MLTLGSSILYGHSLGKFFPYAFLGISCKLQLIGCGRPDLYMEYGNNEVNTFTNQLKYYKAGFMPGLKAGTLLTKSGKFEITGFYDFAYLRAYSKSNGYGIYQNIGGVGVGYHFIKTQ